MYRLAFACEKRFRNDQCLVAPPVLPASSVTKIARLLLAGYVSIELVQLLYGFVRFVIIGSPNNTAESSNVLCIDIHNSTKIMNGAASVRSFEEMISNGPSNVPKI